jgi:glycerophosphoryl diester phosphodiesterase
MYGTGRHNAREVHRLVSKKPHAPGECAGAVNSHAQGPWQRRISHWILDRLTSYGVQTWRLFVVTLLLVGLGMWRPSADNAPAEIEAPASSATPGGTLLASTASAEEQSSYEWGHELLPKDEPVKPLNIAHRGGKYIAPENTLLGFQEGLRRAEPDVLEFDVHLTADRHLVVIHDDAVDDTTDGTGLVREMTLQEIKRLDAGYEFSNDGGKTYPYRGQGITVPTLEEVYQAFPETPVNVEIKEDQAGIEQALWQSIKETEAKDRTLVVSRKMRVIHRFREVSGEQVATGASSREILAFYLLNRLHLSQLLSLIGGPSYQALQVPEKLPDEYGSLQIVTPEFVRAAHQLDLRVDVWTINTERDMRRVLGYGVDGIMTDRPDILNRVLEGEDKGK